MTATPGQIQISLPPANSLLVFAPQTTGARMVSHIPIRTDSHDPLPGNLSGNRRCQPSFTKAHVTVRVGVDQSRQTLQGSRSGRPRKRSEDPRCRSRGRESDRHRRTSRPVHRCYREALQVRLALSQENDRRLSNASALCGGRH